MGQEPETRVNPIAGWDNSTSLGSRRRGSSAPCVTVSRQTSCVTDRSLLFSDFLVPRSFLVNTAVLSMAFELAFSPHARDHLKGFRKRDQQIILDAIIVQLSHQPFEHTKHRKRLEQNPLATGE